MRKRQRDYKAEYARRVAKAKAEGFTGYSQKRHIRTAARHSMERVYEYMERHDMFTQLEEMFDTDPLYWEWFRFNYGKGTEA